jgi:hypothetical protein
MKIKEDFYHSNNFLCHRMPRKEGKPSGENRERPEFPGSPGNPNGVSIRGVSIRDDWEATEWTRSLELQSVLKGFEQFQSGGEVCQQN